MFDNHIFSVRGDVDTLPPDEPEDDYRWQEYCRTAGTLDRQHLLDAVLSSLDCEDSPIAELIDEAVRQPFEPGRARKNIVELQALGQALLDAVARAVDDAVTLAQVVGR